MSNNVNNRITVNAYQKDNKLKYFIEDTGFKLSDSILSVFIAENQKPSNEEVQTYPFEVVIHSAKDLLRGQASTSDAVYSFGQESFLTKGTPQVHKNPIIHISLTDAFVESMYIIERSVSLPTNVPRAYQIMNSSIWNFLVPLSDEVIIRGLKRKCKYIFEHAVKNICKNYDRGLYRLAVAKEYADFNARLILESYLSGSHASGVSPINFHSEDVIESIIYKDINAHDIKIHDIMNQKWRFLLVDDKASQPMDTDEETNLAGVGNLPWNCKCTIIFNNLKTLFGDRIIFHKYNTPQITVPENTAILIDYVENLDDAKDALKKNKYDIILLDYLLNEESGGIRYGYDILNDIYSDVDNKRSSETILQTYKNGPDKHFFFMFISAYADAVYRRLLSDGINLSENYWYISTGACPTNTPQLFRYNLLKMMNKRIDDSGIINLSIDSIYDLVYNIFDNKDKNENVRKRAHANYHDVLSLQYYFRNILLDVEFPKDNSSVFYTNESVLMTNFCYNNINLGGMLEHLEQLIHLIAFGTVRQWPELWEEYLYFKAQLNAERKVGETTKNAEDFNSLYELIEDYILKLKTASL